MANNAAPLTLAIDSAADDASLALLRGSELLAQQRWVASETMSKELLAAISALLAEAGIEREAIARVAVNVGPGQYGALRTGVATAQGLALALDVPLAGIGRFEGDVLPHLAAGRPVVAVHDAGRSGYAWAAYVAGSDGQPVEVVAPRLDDLDGLAQRAPADALWCGELPEALRDAIDLEVAPDPAEPRAVALARIAIARDAFGDPAGVDVLYLRPPPITQPKPLG